MSNKTKKLISECNLGCRDSRGLIVNIMSQMRYPIQGSVKPFVLCWNPLQRFIQKRSVHTYLIVMRPAEPLCDGRSTSAVIPKTLRTIASSCLKLFPRREDCSFVECFNGVPFKLGVRCPEESSDLISHHCQVGVFCKVLMFVFAKFKISAVAVYSETDITIIKRFELKLSPVLPTNVIRTDWLVTSGDLALMLTNGERISDITSRITGISHRYSTLVHSCSFREHNGVAN
ncbi:hypothetical protein DAPPUDRAFT_239269 [Daphnia pulex]|uniref:Uncharacterized protein n=1 Tax=Daphnia pulex TaxID=6669 RepID=E9G8T7_DAPPU|nr:hypothetical protein DAPPUDRAFT_239269 [Daphnia pulex]|eukprot:EFX84033.1 hypothetical protein DAPPUDRAFT_239269 [Daphnia pulex]